jgi:hypothetical protein
MEYVNGVSLSRYLQDADLSDVKRIAQVFIEEALRHPQSGKQDARDIFLRKTAEIRGKLARHSFASSYRSVLKESLKILEGYAWDSGSPSPCHGDMTFENIIVGNRGLYLIDFLDSFYDSWIMDIGKLLQDLETYWSFRHEPVDQNTRVRCAIMKEILLRGIAEKRGKDAVAFAYHALLMNLLRIAPYLRDERTGRFLADGMAKTVRIIQRGDFL